MKKIIFAIITLCMLFSASFTAAYADNEIINPFSDVSSDAWYHDEIVKAVETGIINGKTATEFKPDDLLTYAEAIKLAACMNQVYLNGRVTLENGEPWYKPYADFCYANKIILKEYNFEENATRAGYMEIFANALPDSAFYDINNIPDGSILDVKENSPYAIYVYKLYRSGIVTGVDALHNCNPDDNIKRCEVAAIISRMMDKDKRVKFNMPGAENNSPSSETDNGITPGSDDISDIKDVTINDENEAIVVQTPETNGTPEIEAGESPTLPGIWTEDPVVEIVPDTDYNIGINDYTLSPLTIHKQPQGYEAEKYGEKCELEVQVFGGKPPYSYQWFYYTGHRNETAKVENGDYAKDVTIEALVLSIEKENNLLGKQIFCEITDSEGTKVNTDRVRVYGPFSMPVDHSLAQDGKNILEGRVADGVLKPGDKISVVRNGKVIAIGVAQELIMFNKSLDEAAKGDNIGISFDKEDGVRPATGDIVVKYQPSHLIDTSDIVN